MGSTHVYMRKTLVVILSMLIFCARTGDVFGRDKVSGASANMAYESNVMQTEQPANMLLIKKTVIKKVLNKYNSPLVGSADAFIDACVKYTLDCYLLPSIAGLESTFGKFIHPQSYNPFGWGRGYIMFSQWKDAINTVAKGLRERYIDQGAQNTVQIGRIYSESPTWANRVDFLKKQFYNEEEQMQSINFIL